MSTSASSFRLQERCTRTRAALAVLSAIVMLFSAGKAAAAAGPEDNGRLRLTPTKVTLSAGATEVFTVEATNPDSGERWDASGVATLTTTDPVGTVEGNVYTAGQAGTWTIEARLGSETATAAVKVKPGRVASVSVNPNSLPEVVGLGSTRRFTAVAFDRMNNVVPNVVVAWSLNGAIGTLEPDGTFRATKAGQGRLSASVGSIVGTVDLLVRPAAVDAPHPAVPTANGNANTGAVNVNGGAVLGTEDQPAENAPTGEVQSNCWNLRWWGWLMVLAGFLLVLYGYYRLIETKTAPWVWIAPVLLTAGLLVVYFLTRCPGTAGWFPWLAVIGGLILSLFRPIRFVPTNGRTL